MAINTSMQVLLLGGTVGTDEGREVMEKIGFTDIIEASDNASAWEMLQANRPEIIIAERQTRTFDGLAFLQRIRASEEYKHLVVILLFVAMPSHADRLAMNKAEAGVNAWIPGTPNEVDLHQILEGIFRGLD